MADGHRGILMQQKHRHGLAHNIAAAHHHTVLAGRVNAVFMQDFHNTGRRTGLIIGLSLHDAAHIFRMECVHILIRCNRFQHHTLIYLLRQGQLHQNTVHRAVIVHLFHQVQHIFLRSVLRQMVIIAHDTALGAVPFLITHIDLRGGIVPYQNNCQTRLAAQFRHLFTDLRFHFLGKGLAVHDHCTHFVSS